MIYIPPRVQPYRLMSSNRLAQLEVLAIADAGVLTDSGVLLGGPLTERERAMIRHTVALVHGVYQNIADVNASLSERLRKCLEDHPDAEQGDGMSVVA